jgi:predicted SpoU family rRNA methylase
MQPQWEPPAGYFDSYFANIQQSMNSQFQQMQYGFNSHFEAYGHQMNDTFQTMQQNSRLTLVWIILVIMSIILCMTP